MWGGGGRRPPVEGVAGGVGTRGRPKAAPGRVGGRRPPLEGGAGGWGGDVGGGRRQPPMVVVKDVGEAAEGRPSRGGARGWEGCVGGGRRPPPWGGC